MKPYFLIVILAALHPVFSQSTTNFKLPQSLDLKVSLILPSSSQIISHDASQEGDCIVAQIGDDRDGGMIVSISKDEQILWTHDFGYNLSATPGCKICVSINPLGNAILIHYYGYKWDHSHILLFVSDSKNKKIIEEYSSAKSDIQPFLEKRSDFSTDIEYIFQPITFTKNGLTFECIPIKDKPEVHPFDQGAPWFEVLTTITDKQRIVPISVKTAH